MLTVTLHAIERFIERVDPHADHDAALAALSSPAVQAAASFGASTVRLPTGHRIILKEGRVVTVLPSAHYRAQILRQNIAPQVRNRKNYTYAFKNGGNRE